MNLVVVSYLVPRENGEDAEYIDAFAQLSFLFSLRFCIPLHLFAKSILSKNETGFWDLSKNKVAMLLNRIYLNHS